VTRTNGLVYAPDGADYLVVPSNGGADKPPAWLFNLEAKPEVEIQIGRQRQKGNGRVVEPADPEYTRLWKSSTRTMAIATTPTRRKPPVRSRLSS
jgi:deazaflavin-dependent oxidoreductase (nitroreductase family)